MSDDANRYKATIHLPATDFPMRGDLPRREPETQARWEAEDLYARIRGHATSLHGPHIHRLRRVCIVLLSRYSVGCAHVLGMFGRRCLRFGMPGVRIRLMLGWRLLRKCRRSE